MYFSILLIASLLVSARSLATPHCSSFCRGKDQRAASIGIRGRLDSHDSAIQPSSTAETPINSTSSADPTTVATADPAATSSVGSGGRPFGSFYAGVNTGQGTFYATGLGACGVVNTDGDYIAAVSKLLYDVVPGYSGTNPNNNPICGQRVQATYQGKSVTVTITDRCEACQPTDLDFSPTAFNTLADPTIGRISGVTWTFV